MRITFHLDAPDCVVPCPYAVLWLDGNSHKWVREGHVGLDLPEWGLLSMEANDTLICGPHDMTPRCVLEGLKPARSHPVREGDAGSVQWCGSPSLPPRSGHWLVKQIDVQNEQPVAGS